MNYSTLKKTVALSFVSLMAVGMVKAQTSTTTAKDSSKMSSATSTAKVFGGLNQYSTWSVGVNLGVTSPFLFTGGTNAATDAKIGFGYGVSVREKLAHSFSLQLDLHGGTVTGDNTSAPNGVNFGGKSFSTTFYSGTISGLANVASVDFMHRKNAVNFYLSAGIGLANYKPTYVDAAGNNQSYTNRVKELVIPAGGSVKFRLTEELALNVGYTENFMDGYNFSGYHTYNQYGVVFSDHYSYGWAGLEYTFGTKTKPNLDWVNPVAMMYDELYDAALRQEVEALKGRVTNVENAVNDLKKDSDGDGVADQFDKCPNTPAGTVVDGSGCPLVIKLDTAAVCKFCAANKEVAATAYSNIQFEFDSSVLKTSSYPVLDATSSDLRSNSSVVTLAGYASSEGTAAHNMRLSRDRANSVKTYLVNSGVDAKRLKIKAFGETHPIADNSTEDGRILNRRVEFHK
ncbi:MAG TPA: OmpA family protein [Mucilaginibacter sp.]|jgi:OOP family OmpA-OmpF porin